MNIDVLGHTLMVHPHDTPIQHTHMARAYSMPTQHKHTTNLHGTTTQHKHTAHPHAIQHMTHVHAMWVCHKDVSCGCRHPRAGDNRGYKWNYGRKMGAIGGSWRKTAENGTPWSNSLLGENPGCLKIVTPYYIYIWQIHRCLAHNLILKFHQNKEYRRNKVIDFHQLIKLCNQFSSYTN